MSQRAIGTFCRHPASRFIDRLLTRQIKGDKLVRTLGGGHRPGRGTDSYAATGCVASLCTCSQLKACLRPGEITYSYEQMSIWNFAVGTSTLPIIFFVFLAASATLSSVRLVCWPQSHTQLSRLLDCRGVDGTARQQRSPSVVFRVIENHKKTFAAKAR